MYQKPHILGYKKLTEACNPKWVSKFVVEYRVLYSMLGFRCHYSPVTGRFPSQRPAKWSFDVFFDLRLNKRLSKQSKRWWFETSSRSLWRHGNARPIFRIGCACPWNELSRYGPNIPSRNPDIMSRNRTIVGCVTHNVLNVCSIVWRVPKCNAWSV